MACLETKEGKNEFLTVNIFFFGFYGHSSGVKFVCQKLFLESSELKQYKQIQVRLIFLWYKVKEPHRVKIFVKY